MKIINMTKNDIIVYSQDGSKVLATYPASGKLIRIKPNGFETKGTLNGAPLVSVKLEETIGLPKFKDGVFYLVDAFVKKAFPDRRDLLVPLTPTMKDGRKIGCIAFGV